MGTSCWTVTVGDGIGVDDGGSVGVVGAAGGMVDWLKYTSASTMPATVKTRPNARRGMVGSDRFDMLLAFFVGLAATQKQPSANDDQHTGSE